MEKKIQYLLDKYEPKSLNSIKIENDILDFEKDIIFEKESQIPNFVIDSSCPFDKNYCFYGISLKVSTKENIFPKEKYFLKSQQIVELKPIDINKIFDDDTIFKNDSPKNPEDKDEEEKTIDEDSVQQKIISSIKNHHYKSYIPKNLDKNVNEIDNEWYIIENNTEEGPFNDFSMYIKLYKIYYDSKGNFPNYLLKEKKSDIFMTMNDCFNRLRAKYEYTKQNTVNNEYLNQLKLQYMNNLLIYNTQMLKYYQTNTMNTMNNMNSINNKNNQNNQNTDKKNVPNKFDNSNNRQIPANVNNNTFNNNRKNDNRNNINKFNNNNIFINNNRRNYNFPNNRGKNIYNSNGDNGIHYYNNNQPRHRNKYNRKEKRVDKDYREKNENSDNINKKELKQKKSEKFNKKDETTGENKAKVNEENKDGQKSINVDKFFEK